MRAPLLTSSLLVIAAVVRVGAATAQVDPAPAPAIAALAAARATVLHVPVAAAVSSKPVSLVAVVDGAWAEPVLLARYRTVGGPWREAAFERSSAGGWYATIPGDAVQPPGAEYYIVGLVATGEVGHFASALRPQPIRVEPTVYDRLAHLDRERTAGRTESITLDVDGHDFGNRYDGKDRFLRGELRWQHRISSRLHSVGFGFGTISGHTPDREGPEAGNALRSARYGLAELRLRPHPSLFIDTRLVLGVSHDGFMPGVGGAVFFGKPWRSNVSIGGESLRDLGGSAWVRLQWDTATPVLMGAAIVRSDLPGVVIDPNGLYLKYDAAYRLDPGFAVRAAVSYGSRDGAGSFGGGLGLEANF